MFKLSSGFKSGLRTLTLLAQADPTHPLPISEMAPALELSDKYLEQLLMALRRAGLVRSVRGASGGFHLSQNPANITLLEVLRALQGPVELCDCNQPDCRDCVRPEIWKALEASFEETLSSLTLEHVISKEPFQIQSHPIVRPDSPIWLEGGGI